MKNTAFSIVKILTNNLLFSTPPLAALYENYKIYMLSFSLLTKSEFMKLGRKTVQPTSGFHITEKIISKGYKPCYVSFVLQPNRVE
jgi:hypothetical protein